ncbi:MerR family transcriptional regulator [Achromobacter veterisilvae]|uniref:MerR family transcriptional regulator n=1 Tax=Achromobacter veterisilvae TaxID=2069367 RepID=A0ABZ2RZ28_9BURK|nr:MerR family transcriptional regulator [Achromobacter veterisilvae]
MTTANFRIGDIARLTGISISTLRLWEQHGLITPERTEKGQRVYTDAQLQKVHTIQRLRRVEGLNMTAIKRVIASQFPSPPQASSDDASIPGSYTPDVTPLGARFRAARVSGGMSLKQAADASGLPISFISTFERTNRGATVASLQKLAASYGTTVTELSTSGSRSTAIAAEVVRRGEEIVAPQFEPGIRILQLANQLQALDCQRWILAPGVRSEGAYSHAGEEFIHVLKGELIITVDNDAAVRLHVGDSISFDSRKPHMWVANGEGETELLWVNTPKSY